jgi:outer membrane protein OmpA-like peptidoglycan-associated protein
MKFLFLGSIFFVISLGHIQVVSAQAYGRATPPTEVQQRVYEPGELSVERMIELLRPDAAEGTKGYTPSGRWVKIEQDDLNNCFQTAQSAGLAERTGAGTKNWFSQMATDKYFDVKLAYGNDRHEPDAAGLREVARFAQAIKDNSLYQRRFAIEGHANATGTAAQNREVTCRRAARIREILRTQYGIAAERLMAIGRGASQPKEGLAPTDAGNRRVSFRLIGLN